MEENNNEQLALVNELSDVEVTKELVTTEDFSKKYESLVALKNYIDNIKATIDDGLKTIVKDNYYSTGESSVASTEYRYTYVPETTRETVDAKTLKANDPELYKKYVKVSSVKESFRVTKLTKKDE